MKKYKTEMMECDKTHGLVIWLESTSKVRASIEAAKLIMAINVGVKQGELNARAHKNKFK